LAIPILGKVFDKSGDIIDAVKKLINEPEFSEKLDRAGGFIALLGIGITIYDDIKNSLKTDEQKAFGALLKIAFESASETLVEANRKYFKGAELEGFGKDFKKGIMESLLDSFRETSDWNSYLPEHPTIREFRRIMIGYLKERGVDSETINDFVLRLNLRIEEKAGSNEEFKKFYMWWTLEEQYSALKKYLEYVKNKMYYLKGLDKKPLYEYYVWHKAIVADTDTWNWDEEEFDKDAHYRNKIQDIRQIIREFLLSRKENWYLVIAAPFGSGKTSMVRMISSVYASSYLNRTQEVEGNEGDEQEKKIAILDGHSYFIPILVFLKGGLNNVYWRNNLDDVLFDITHSSFSSSSPEGNREAQERPILLILDGLDEYEEKVQDLIDITLKEQHRKYRNMKIIITTRLKAGFPGLLHIADSYVDPSTDSNTYVRLLSFTEDQVNQFFKKTNTPLSYQRVSQFGLHHEEITKPLFAWMLSLLHTDPEYKIDFPKNWSSRETKSFIYMLFFHYVIEGKSKQTLQTDRWKGSYISEKKMLRQIAALKQLGRGDLNLEEIKRLAKVDRVNADLEPILTSYFYLRTGNQGGRVIEFVHETFKEYLLAEYYIESLLEDRTYRLSIGTPSWETIEFLYGLLELLKRTRDNGNNNDNEHNNINIEKYLVSDETSLLASFNRQNRREEAINQLISSATTCVESEDIFCSGAKDITETLENWVRVKIFDDDFANLWMYRWISLAILKTLDYSKNINKEKLVRLITFSGGNWIPYNVKNLRNMDLLGANLWHANLQGANLSQAKLLNANLWQADLSRTKLLNANLSHANLWHGDLSLANLGHSELSHANLLGANLSQAKLLNANLSHANLSNANLWHANLSNADLSNANLSHANLLGAILSNANLSHANLLGANLWHANLQGANLQRSNLQGASLHRANLSEADLSDSLMMGITKFGYLKCVQAKFDGALIDDQQLIDYLNSNGAESPHEALHPLRNRDELKKRLKDKNFTEEQIKSLWQSPFLD
jgi:uncharacterized protein YjbI with pentapeptide repeats